MSIGDDAAILDPVAGALVWTIDSSVEGVHFQREWLTLEDVGWRSLMAASSDLAAMAAWPRGVLSALVLPPDTADGELEALARGQAAAAQAIQTAVVGGNLSRGSELSLTTTVLGTTKKPLRRTGAAPGDVVALGGQVGLARAGLDALRRRLTLPASEAAIEAWRRPRARIEDGLVAGPWARAGIDISDGLALDAWRVAAASRVRIELDRRQILELCGDTLASIALELSLDPLDLALRGGEDYALLIVLPEGIDLPGFVPIGTCVEGEGLALRDDAGAVTALVPDGFDHFR